MTYELSAGWVATLILVMAWDLFWKSIALWRAARLGHPVWFGFLLVVNGAGILPIVYLFTHHESESHMITTGGAV